MSELDIKNKIANLSTDLSFIRWVHSDFEIDDEIWSEFIDENIELSDDINREIGIVRNLRLSPKSEIDTQQLWLRIQDRIEFADNNDKVPVRKLMPKYAYIAAIAASLTVLLVFLWLMDFNTSVIKAESGQDISHVLPDGSEVFVDAGSEIRYDKNSFVIQRDVELRGRAFFKVEKGKSFTVGVTGGTVSVLGTSFSVLSREGGFEVTCHTGKVKMTLDNGQSSVLLPGQKCIQDNQSIICSDQTGAGDDWTKGIYTYKDVVLQNVLYDLQEQFGIQIKASEAIKQKKYSGYFDQSNLDKALQSVTWPLQLTYRMDNGVVYIQQ